MTPIDALYFDGRSARANPVRLDWVDGRLHIAGDGIERDELPARVHWPERTRHGRRIAQLPDGASLQALDAAAWDAFVRDGGLAEPAVVRLQQSWRWVLASVVLLAALLVAGYQWGLPWAARGVVALLPERIDRAAGEAALDALDGHGFGPSRLTAPQQQRIAAALDRALATLPDGRVPPHRLLFRSSAHGPNAFALPGGSIVLTDELVRLVDGDEAVLTGVLAHEVGHLAQRHGMRMLVQTAALGAAVSLLIGDVTGLLATVPMLLGQAGYSRDAEREADGYALRVLQSAGIPPRVMVAFFEKIAATRPGASGNDGDSWIGIAIGSHPADAERIRRFEQAAPAP